ncbi:hypothetical protein CROQUDRAFT_94983 [Cronartium quercuum f. sp. fusiforme G11]|uniref:Uncharacterized protein n=1 Tax=Cronartium quercuum f. sp. fusiforme G11 TaxID=708437 RepID=A0A9P6NI22_9BASI|nr:hypothetical protein CROQUDRAFT_94983 [Cronartium quercuum f. sp. fusiforme G11]
MLFVIALLLTPTLVSSQLTARQNVPAGLDITCSASEIEKSVSAAQKTCASMGIPVSTDIATSTPQATLPSTQTPPPASQDTLPETSPAIPSPPPTPQTPSPAPQTPSIAPETPSSASQTPSPASQTPSATPQNSSSLKPQAGVTTNTSSATNRTSSVPRNGTTATTNSKTQNSTSATVNSHSAGVPIPPKTGEGARNSFGSSSYFFGLSASFMTIIRIVELGQLSRSTCLNLKVLPLD